MKKCIDTPSGFFLVVRILSTFHNFGFQTQMDTQICHLIASSLGHPQ